MDESNPMRIVILGKTGAGKSSLANTIFGEDKFMIDDSANSGTIKCEAETKSVNGRSITLIDTPGLFDTDRSEKKLKTEIVRCITECAPGPHAFLIVLKVEKYTEQEQAVVNKINQYFSEEAFRYATVLFTHGDQLRKGQKIDDFVRQNKPLSDLVKKCGGRCHVIDNRYWKEKPNHEYRSNQLQVEELLKTIDKIFTEKNGNCYSNEMLQAVEEEIKQEEEKLRRSSRNMTEEEIRRQAKANVLIRLLGRFEGFGVFLLLAALCGVATPVAAVTAAITVAVVGVPAAVAAVEGAVRAAVTALKIIFGYNSSN